LGDGREIGRVSYDAIILVFYACCVVDSSDSDEQRSGQYSIDEMKMLNGSTKTLELENFLGVLCVVRDYGLLSL